VSIFPVENGATVEKQVVVKYAVKARTAQYIWYHTTCLKIKKLPEGNGYHVKLGKGNKKGRSS